MEIKAVTPMKTKPVYNEALRFCSKEYCRNLPAKMQYFSLPSFSVFRGFTVLCSAKLLKAVSVNNDIVSET